MVLISVISYRSKYIGYSVVIYHKKSSDLVIGNLLIRLGTLLVDVSTVTEPFSLLVFMCRGMPCEFGFKIIKVKLDNIQSDLDGI